MSEDPTPYGYDEAYINQKALEYARQIYADGYDDPMYKPDVSQTIRDFTAGFKACLMADVDDSCKCIRYAGGNTWYHNGCKIHST